MPRRTLAEELAELATTGPAPDLDSEGNPFGDGPTLEESDEEAAAAPSGRRRLGGDMGDMGEEYAGRRTSRAAAFGLDGARPETNGIHDDGESDRSDEASDESDGHGADMRSDSDAAGGDDTAESSDDGDADSLDAEVAELGEALEADRRAGSRKHEADSDLEDAEGGGQPYSADRHSEEGDDDGSVAARQAGHLDAKDGDLAALEREFDAVEAADADAAAGMADRVRAERRKGVAAARQRKLWERALEVRIRAQKAVLAAHRLPGSEAHAAAAALSAPLAEGFSAVSAAAAAALELLLGLQDALLAQNPAIREAADAAAPAEGGNGKRRQPEGCDSQTANELWERIEEGSAACAPYRDASLDRWHRRALLGGGAAAMRPGLKALAQPISVQVAAALTAPGKSVTRSQLPRSTAAPVLCDVAPDSAAAEAEQEAGEAGIEVARLQDTYDDADFYEQLLKEFLEGATPGAGAGIQKGPKRRKTVDRRASKGRKLRFHVHEKLVNFMTPTAAVSSAVDDSVGAALFSNLFGRSAAAAVAAH